MHDPIIFESTIVNVNFGKDVKIVRPVNLYGCTVGENTFVGPFVEIQRDVTIGKFCKIQSHTFVCELVNIGDRCFIGHGVMFINDLFEKGGPANGNKALWRSTQIGNDVSIGSNSTILPVKICDGAVIGAGTVVTKDIIEKGIYAGNPAKLIRKL